MSFGLTKAQATFMYMMNRVFSQYLDFFIIVFNNVILVYLKSEVDHVNHLLML